MGYDLTDYPNILRWFKEVQTTLPGYNEAVREGIIEFNERVLSKLQNN